MTLASERGRKWCRRDKKIVAALVAIKDQGREQFLSRDAASVADMTPIRFGNILRFTSGVKHLKKGMWIFTGEKIEVASA